MTTLVKRGTARRLGLRPPLRARYRYYRQRWEMPPGSGLEWSTTFPATGTEWRLGETRLG